MHWIYPKCSHVPLEQVLDVPVWLLGPTTVVLDAPVGPAGFGIGPATVILDVPVGFEMARGIWTGAALLLGLAMVLLDVPVGFDVAGGAWLVKTMERMHWGEAEGIWISQGLGEGAVGIWFGIAFGVVASLLCSEGKWLTILMERLFSATSFILPSGST
jgi:hypothetical protein